MSSVAHYPKLHLALPSLSILSGLILLLLLPVGLLVGIQEPLFTNIFRLHIVVHLICLVLALRVFLRLILTSSIERIVSSGLLLLLLALILVEAGVPVTARDALVHHLAVPKWWIDAGKIYEINWHEWSYYPMLMNLAFTALLNSGLESLVSHYHATYLLLSAALIANFLELKTKNRDTALWGAIVTLSIPICFKLAATPLVDLGLAYYSGVAFYLICSWAGQSGNQAKGGLTTLILAGLALGLALGTKYNALLLTAIMLGFLPILAARAKRGKSETFLAIGTIFSLSFLAFLPWMLKNLIWTLNPLYPQMQSWFSPLVSSGAAAVAGGLPGLSPLMHRHLIYGESWLEIALIPLRILFEGSDGDKRSFDGALSPILLLCALPFLKPKKDPWIVYALFITFTYLGFAIVLQALRVRYLTPILVPSVALCMIGYEQLSTFVTPLKKALFQRLVLAVHILWFCNYLYISLSDSEGIAYAYERLKGEGSSKRYLTKHLIEYEMIQSINELVPRSSRIYLLYSGNQFYYYLPYVVSAYDSGSRLVRWLRASMKPSYLLAEMRSQSIDHILIHQERTKASFGSALTLEEQKVWHEFVTLYLDKLSDFNTRAGRYSLYKLKTR
jgi:hypothetical protein